MACMTAIRKASEEVIALSPLPKKLIANLTHTAPHISAVCVCVCVCVSECVCVCERERECVCVCECECECV